MISTCMVKFSVLPSYYELTWMGEEELSWVCKEGLEPSSQQKSE